MTTLYADGFEYPNIVIEGLRALSRQDYNRFTELLENGLDINSVGPGQTSYLFAQVYYLHVECVEFLLENGIDPNSVDLNGFTPLDYVNRIPNIKILTDEEIPKLHTIKNLLRQYNGYTSNELQILRATNNEELENDLFSRQNSIDSIPSDPDYELMRNQAATQIQKRIRGRQFRQMRNYTRRNTGIESLNPTMRERFRRFSVHNRKLEKDDPLSGYLHDVYFPPKMSSLSSKSKSKRKVAKRTKKKRSKRNRY